MQDLQIQLDALIDFKSYLESFQSDLENIAQEYNKTVHSLIDNGLTLQISENYESKYWIVNDNDIKKIIENIESSDLYYINLNIAQTEEAIRNAML